MKNILGSCLIAIGLWFAINAINMPSMAQSGGPLSTCIFNVADSQDFNYCPPINGCGNGTCNHATWLANKCQGFALNFCSENKKKVLVTWQQTFPCTDGWGCNCSAPDPAGAGGTYMADRYSC